MALEMHHSKVQASKCFRLACESLPFTNTLAYLLPYQLHQCFLQNSLSFPQLLDKPRACTAKLFTAVICGFK
jgi:hypothetical protein